MDNQGEEKNIGVSKTSNSHKKNGMGPLFAHALIVFLAWTGGLIVAFSAAMFESREYGRNVTIIYISFVVLVNTLSSLKFSRKEVNRLKSFIMLFLIWPVIILVIYLVAKLTS